MRSRFEASTRAGNTDSFRALQKLIYVSDLVFGVQKVSTPGQCSGMQCSRCSDYALASGICQGSEAHLEVQNPRVYHRNICTKTRYKRLKSQLNAGALHHLRCSDDALTSARDLESHVQVQCSVVCNRNCHTTMLLVSCQFGAGSSEDPPQRPLVNGKIKMLIAVQLQIKIYAGGWSPHSSL